MRRVRYDQDLLRRFGLHGERWQRTRRRFMPYCTACHETHEHEESCPHLWDDPIAKARLVRVKTLYLRGRFNDETPETRRFLFVRWLIRHRRMER